MSEQAFVLSPHVVVTVMENGAVLLNLQSKYFYSVNQTGWSVIQLLEQGVTYSQVMAQCRKHGAEDADEQRVKAFWDLFVDEQMVAAADKPEVLSDVDWTGEWIGPVAQKHAEPLQKVMVSAFDPSLPLAE